MEGLRFSRLFLPKVQVYLAVIFVLILVICFLEPVFIIPSLITYIAVLVYWFSENKVRKKEFVKYIETLNFDIDSATKDNLLRFPLPLLVAEPTGELIWYNSLFEKIIENKSGHSKTKNALYKIFQDVNDDSESNIFMETSIGDWHYLVFGNRVNVEKNHERPRYIYMLYFLEQTEKVLLEKKVEETRPVVAIIAIDNFEEVMQNASDISKPQIIAEVDKKISADFLNTGCIFKKYERDKYLAVFEHRYLSELEEKKFEIIDAIKEINVGNKIPVTLSIGIGLSGENMGENLSLAVAALDISLGRGGDQVVIKDGEKYSFYGGRSKEVEKRSRVKARVVAHALGELVNQAEQVIIMGHMNTDIDSVGASLGLYRVAKARNKKAYIVLNNSNIMIANLMDKVHKEKAYEGVFITKNEALDKISKDTLLIVVDTHKPSFTECPELLKFTDKVVIIDHHRKSTEFISETVLEFHETYASSACELVAEILHYLEMEKEISPVEAEALYAGITIDTKNFTFKTGVRTFEAVTFLKKAGVDAMLVKQLFQNDFSTYIARAEVVRNAEIIDEIAISECPENIKNASLIAAQAADELLGISGVSASFVLCKVNDVVLISGRSLGEINVQVILERMGGGGHMSVAGSQMNDISTEEAREKLKENILAYIEENKTEDDSQLAVSNEQLKSKKR